MTARFQRGGVKGVSPFFAFQDIITSAMAVLIAIIMMLAMYMGGGEPAGSTQTRTRELNRRLNALLEELTGLRREVQVAGDGSKDEILDPQLLKVQVSALREELAAATAQTRSKASQTAVVQKMEGATLIQRDLDGLKEQLEAERARIAKMETDATGRRQEMEGLEKLVQEREAQLLAERARRNQIWLIPEHSNSSKQPILAVVSANALTLQRFDRPEMETLNGTGVTRDLEASLKKYSKLDYYIVFYFKPSGVDHFIRLTEIARNAGFEIGYDAVGEEVSINFSAPK